MALNHRPERPAPRVHGGPGADGPARWDFSTCANAAGPCPQALQALRAADPTRYPDPGYVRLRERLAEWHGVEPRRIVLAASASEFVQRITAVGQRLAPGPVGLPAHAYGDYAAAAAACTRGVVGVDDARATLRWLAEPSSPLGQDTALPPSPGAVPTVLDAVYAPLRLAGASRWSADDRDAVFVLHSPNKALGLCGLRGAYAVAPAAARVDWDLDDWLAALAAAEPSWPLGSHGVAMLQAWTDPTTQAWLDGARETLRGWTVALVSALSDAGFVVRPGGANFRVVRPPPGAPDAVTLRRDGIAVRDTASFGLPGEWRVSAQPPQALDALRQALRRHGG